jgi:hypothetical protein
MLLENNKSKHSPCPLPTTILHPTSLLPPNNPALNPTLVDMPKTLQTSKHKWQREKFWAFMLLGLNRMLNHDFLPPWGFEFLLRVNTQAWWYYSHYGFGARYESESQDKQEDGQSLSDEASVGERPTSSSRADTKPHDDWARSEFLEYAHSNPFLGFQDRQDPERVLECASSEPGRFGTQLHCPVCCT